MPQSALFRLVQIGRRRLVLAAMLVGLSILGISWLAVDLARQVEEQSETRTDNAQWLLSQFELELLYLIDTADEARHGVGSLEDVRLRFDIFFGRLKMLREGRVSEQLRKAPNFDRDFAQLEGFMAKYLPLIDGPDAALLPRLSDMVADGRNLNHTARNLSLTGVKLSAVESDARRLTVSRTLILTGLLTLVLVAFLLALLAMLLRLYRFNRQRAAENLATLSRLNAVVSTTMEALVTVDGQGRIQDFNDAARQAFGLTLQAARGRDMAELFLPSGGSIAPFRPGLAPEVEDQGRFRLTAVHADAKHFPVEVSISRVRDMVPALFVVFLRDLSAQLQAEQALVSARDKALAGEKAKADLLAVMSHEIRTPLNGMIGTIDLLDHTALDDAQRGYLRILQASGRLLMHHVNDVLDIARLDSGMARPVAARIDLQDIVREVIENQLPASRENANDLSFEADPAGFVVLADGAQLRQILLNLVGNAVKFTRGGKIAVRLLDLPKLGWVRIEVSDTGIGIAKDDVARIFEDFVTLDASYSRGSSGTGLGLGIVRRIVGQMGGRLDVESRKGKGSTFSVDLPMARLVGAPSSQEAGGEVEPQQGPPLSVLVVEDNEFNRLIVVEFLRGFGHRVAEAKDGESGILLASEQGFDVILMDISMPGLDGVQAAAAIRANLGPNRLTPVVAMTAHAMADDLARFRAGGMGWVLVKPITRDALAAVLSQIAPALPATLDEPVLDRGVLAALRKDLGPEHADRLVQRFCAEVGETGRKLLAAGLQDPDAPTMRLAHQLAGSAAMFGATALSCLLHRIETAWKTGEMAGALALQAHLAALLQDTEAQLQDDGLAQDSSLR